jgi:hypothetical protein
MIRVAIETTRWDGDTEPMHDAGRGWPLAEA